MHTKEIFGTQLKSSQGLTFGIILEVFSLNLQKVWGHFAGLLEAFVFLNLLVKVQIRYIDKIKMPMEQTIRS